MSTAHRPVMLATCLEYLAPKPDRWYVDGTFGAGGHSRALLDDGANVLAIDQDPQADRFAKGLAGPRFKLVQGNFRYLEGHLEASGIAEVHGVLFDLGVSSMQLDEAGRGFAFRHDGPLDMRMSTRGRSAAEVVNTATTEELAAILYKYGEERYSRRVARAIVAARDRATIGTTGELAAVVQQSYPQRTRHDHPARRTFQALRIFVNDELAALSDGLAASDRVLAGAGRLVVLSYHSLEDRIVKQFVSRSKTLTPLTSKPITASADEVAANPRARSAKLRASEKASS